MSFVFWDFLQKWVRSILSGEKGGVAYCDDEFAILADDLRKGLAKGRMWKKSSKTHDTLLTTLEETTKLETHPGSGCRAFEIADGSLLGHDLDVKGPNVGF